MYSPEGGNSVSVESTLLCLVDTDWDSAQGSLVRSGGGGCRGAPGGGGDTVAGKFLEGVGVSGGGMPLLVVGRLGLWRGVTLVPSTAADTAGALAGTLTDCRLATSLSRGGQTSCSKHGTTTFCKGNPNS